MKSANQLSNTSIYGYGLANFGYGFVTQVFASYFVFYATAILMMPGSIIGLIVALSIVWDGISDPIMGYISDRTRSKYGKRHIYILVGTISTALINVLLWHVPIVTPLWIKFVWTLLCVFLFKSAVTVFVTPYAALGAEMSTDYHERSKIQGIKTIFFLAALMIVTAVCMFVFFKPTPEFPLGQLNPEAYRYMAYTSSVVLMITGWLTYVYTQPFKLTQPDYQSASGLNSFIKTIKVSFENREFKFIFLGYLFTNIASAIIGVIGLHTFTYTFQLNNYKIGIVLGLQFTVCILTQPIWLVISRRTEKKIAIMWGLLVSVFACFVLSGMVYFRDIIIQDYQYLMIYATIIGFGTSGLFSIPLSMIADTVDLQEQKTGERNEGVFYGILNLGFKVSQSIAILILGFILDLIRFNPDMDVQSKMTSLNLGFVLSIGSLVSFVFAILAYSHYSLNKEQIHVIQKAVNK